MLFTEDITLICFLINPVLLIDSLPILDDSLIHGTPHMKGSIASTVIALDAIAPASSFTNLAD
jgi:hypothetical protein